MSLRSFLFWCHLTAGLFAGAVILLMSATGVLLTYERQMLAWADTRGLGISGPAGATRLAIEELVARVQTARPDLAPTAVTVSADPGRPVAVSTGPRSLQVHPYTGEVLGEGAVGLRAFFRAVTDWHRWLAMTGESRTTGRAITGASNLAFLFIVASGLVLWCPRAVSWIQFRQVLFFRVGLRGKARDFNWHNVIGVWSAVPLFIVVLGGVVISYPWATDLLFRAMGEAPPPRTRPGVAASGRPGEDVRASGGHGAAARRLQMDGLSRAMEVAATHEPGWRTLTVRLPSSNQMPVSVAIDTGTGGQPQKRQTVEVDPRTGAITRLDNYAGQSAGRRTRSWLRFAHTGEVYGLPGQTVAGLVSLGGVILVWTGIALALRRFLAWRVHGESRKALKVSKSWRAVPVSSIDGTGRRERDQPG